MWDYYDGYTAAQIELMAIDTPLVVYPKNKKKKKGEFKKANALDVLKKASEWEQKYGKAGDKAEQKMNFGNFSMK